MLKRINLKPIYADIFGPLFSIPVAILVGVLIDDIFSNKLLKTSITISFAIITSILAIITAHIILHLREYKKEERILKKDIKVIFFTTISAISISYIFKFFIHYYLLRIDFDVFYIPFFYLIGDFLGFIVKHLIHFKIGFLKK